MYKHILVPVDLAHAEKLAKATETAARLVGVFKAVVTFVGVTAGAPTSIGHNPAEYERKLGAFAEDHAATYGLDADTRTYVSHDPSVEIDQVLLNAVEQTGADLVVMASHVPNFIDTFWPSHGGRLAAHASVSVFIVR